MGFFSLSHFVSQFPPTRFPLLTAIGMRHFLPVHHLEWHFGPGQRSKHNISILRVVNYLDEEIVVSSMNAFTGGLWNPPPSSTISVLFSVTFRSSCIARTKSIGDTKHPIAILTSSLFLLVIYSFVVNHMRKPSKYVPSILDISSGIWFIRRDNSIIWWSTDP